MKKTIKLLALLYLYLVYSNCFSQINFSVNKYNNIVAVVSNAKITIDFEQDLQNSLENWGTKNYTAIWLSIPLDQAILIPVALKYKFKPHHTTDQNFVMTKEFVEKILPEYATHTVGAAGLVIDKNNNVLVVKERFKPEYGYKLPGGTANMGEDIWQAAIREVKEETGIDTEFIGIIAWRQGHKPDNQPISDLYFACLLRPLSTDIKIQESEITQACWMPYSEFKKISSNSCAQFLVAYETGIFYNAHKVGLSNLCTFYACNKLVLPAHLAQCPY